MIVYFTAIAMDVKLTNIPAVRANELRLDNFFELEDGTTDVVDYEREYNKSAKVKYLNYLTGVVNQYLKEKRKGYSTEEIVSLIFNYSKNDVEMLRQKNAGK